MNGRQIDSGRADDKISLSFGPLAQPVEQRTFNPLVAGSTPARPTRKSNTYCQVSELSIVVYRRCTGRLITFSLAEATVDKGAYEIAIEAALANDWNKAHEIVQAMNDPLAC
jgi:hypothetical protein